MRSVLIVAAALALVGCEDYLVKKATELAKEELRRAASEEAPPAKSDPPGPTTTPAPEAAPAPPQVDLPNVGLLPDRHQRPDAARLRVELYSARAAVRMYQMEHEGQNPPDLEALGLNLKFRSDFTYDPASGQVKSTTFPGY